MRAILDGHIVLTRTLAQRGQFPAIDALQSVSRLMPQLATNSERQLATDTLRAMALLERNRQMVEMGAYEAGTHAELDAALRLQPALLKWLKQADGGVPRADGSDALRRLVAASADQVRQEGGRQ